MRAIIICIFGVFISEIHTLESTKWETQQSKVLAALQKEEENLDVLKREHSLDDSSQINGNIPEECDANVSAGPCKASISVWTYNRTTSMCEEFIWGGCNASKNMFFTWEDCSQTCTIVEKETVQILECPKLNYNLQGREDPIKMNNVLSWEVCARRCEESDQCSAWVWHPHESGQYKFICVLVKNYKNIVEDPNAIIGASTCQKPESEEPEECTAEFSIGPCKASIPVWFYNKTTDICEKRIWGGCNGSKNMYHSWEDCTDMCKIAAEKVILGISECPKLYYNLQGRINTTHFDNIQSWKECARICQENIVCTAWIWHHRDAGQHKFKCVLVESYESIVEDPNSIIGMSSCQASEDDLPEECRAEVTVGPCKAAIPGWFYNKTTDKCEEFIWGGCHESENMYHIREDCIRTCNMDVCEWPPVTGKCRASIRMWYYNPVDRLCQEFTWGGCGGNENKFSTAHKCHLSCGSSSKTRCNLGGNFVHIGHQAVSHDYQESDWFISDCDSKCYDFCIGNHDWGTCLAYSIRKRWFGCNCYIFNHAVGESMFNDNTKGHTFNRACIT